MTDQQHDYENLSAFFAGLDPRDPEGFANACSAELAWAYSEIHALAQRMRDCPRGDKAQAKEISAARIAVERHIRDLKARRRPAIEAMDRRERHGLWLNAVREVCGPELLAQVQEHMKAARAARRDADRKEAA